MIKCEDLAKIFKENNLTYFSGVPDSTFKDWMKFLSDGNGFENRIAVNECEAVANCAGYHLATGKTGIVYMQNSGLGKTVNPLTSLISNEVYAIPTVLMIGWRGEPGQKDEPQHKMMGRVMLSLLDSLEVPYKLLPDNIREASEVIRWAKEEAERTKYVSAIVIKKGTLEEYVSSSKSEKPYEMTREDAIKTIVDNLEGDEAIVSTTGKTLRELFEHRISKGEAPRDFLNVGSMGCSASIGFEIAMQKPDKPVYIFDGDGAAIMQLGAFVTIGHYKLKNFYHIIFENNAYDSTGGQPTTSDTVNFEQVALGCGYTSAKTVETKQNLIQSIQEMKTFQGPNLLVVKVNKGARKDLGRPTKTPVENKEAFMRFL